MFPLVAPRGVLRHAAGLLFACSVASAAEPGLLFYVSGENGAIADYSAADRPRPTFERGIERIADGAHGAALQCAHTQLLAWRAPGHIYAQRGTLAFFWRAREAVGLTEFPIFRVGYSDHSSWDMVWLRIDYNGHGFDAFVTDASLARTRVSVTVDPFPAPEQWTHLALAWDETGGIRFFVNGKLAAAKQTTARYDAGLDQFGPHSRIISPYQVQSDYNFVRGGDVDEIRIYDRVVGDDAVAALARGNAATNLSDLADRDLSDSHWREEWWFRHGWNRPGDPPPYLEAATTKVRKVEIHDAFDLQRWWWKANDGIRETTWPGVFNRSRLPGRTDYFILPDWDCYSLSGKSVTFTLPDEAWNHVEISGAAWGHLDLAPVEGNARSAARPKDQERTILRLGSEARGGNVVFTNTEQETPIGEFAAYNVTAAGVPADRRTRALRLTQFVDPADEALAPLRSFIAGRYPADERQTMAAVAPAGQPAKAQASVAGRGLPVVHILIPIAWDESSGGLDGIEIQLPALNVRPTHRELFPMNVRVKDPLWPARDMLDFSFSVKPGEARTLWLDTRDRILPSDKPLYCTITAAGPDFTADQLEGATLRLVFKPREEAVAEHSLDRFTQARDAWAMAVEEHPRDERYDLWNRFEGDLADLLRVNPEHELGRQYWAVSHPEDGRPPFTLPEPPDGVPRWAFHQAELLRRVEYVVNWYIDRRQIENGELGGGLSDDTDLTNLWPGTALMGSSPEKITASVRAVLEACYAQGLFTNGLPTIQTDELHTYEEGINALGECLILDPGNPLLLERAMETTRGVAGITGVTAAGHRHIRSSYYSGSKMAEDSVWGWSKPYSYLVLQPAYLLAGYNGNPAARRLITELADGLLAHRRVGADGRVEHATMIHFATDAESSTTRGTFPWPLFWSAWEQTGDRKYLDPLFDMGPRGLGTFSANALDLFHRRDDWGARILTIEQNRSGNRPVGQRNLNLSDAHLAWQVSGDKKFLERLYADQIEALALREFINTEGSLWIDRVVVPHGELQRARLGGIGLVRNGLLPGHAVSWRFAAPATARSMAILIPDATPSAFTVIAYNLETAPVRATLLPGNIDPGLWEITQGIDANGDDVADGPTSLRPADLARDRGVELTFAPRATSVLKFKLKLPAQPYWQRPDLGITRDDVVARGDGVRVKVHSLGSVPTTRTEAVLRARDGRVISSSAVPVMAAPTDLMPTTLEVLLPHPAGLDLRGATVVIDPDERLTEITRANNAVQL